MGRRIYFKVKPQYDGQIRYAYTIDNKQIQLELVANELLTFWEVNKYNVPASWLEEIFIYPEKITTFFGVRFLAEDCTEQVQEKLQRRNEK